MNSLRMIRAGKMTYGRNNVKEFRGWGGECGGAARAGEHNVCGLIAGTLFTTSITAASQSVPG
jgi:hypothetical protein